MSDSNAAPTADELERIRLFRERVEDLRAKGLVKAGKTKVTVHLAGTVPSVIEGFDDDHLVSFLQTLRQFTLNDEPVHFYSIYNVAYRTCNRPELRDWLVYVRSLWKQTLATSPLGIGINGHCPTVAEILDLFLYGGMVHSDREKAERIRNMAPQIQGILKMMLVSGLGGLCHSLVVMDNIVSVRRTASGRGCEGRAKLPA